jgi:methionyl-tRNA formyltransferase
MEIFNIVFIGLDNKTLILLTKSKSLKVVGVNYFDYFDYFSFNPFDQIFKIAYKLHFKKKCRFVSLFLLRIWNILYIFSSFLYRSNKEYLNVILNYNIEILDTEDEKYLRSFFIENKIDLLVINSWGIIPNEIINLSKYKTINIHPSMLPQYRGALPTLWSLKNKDKISALTYIVLNEFIDDGLIINQHLFEIEKDDDWYSLEKKIASILEETLIVDILNYLNNNYLPIKTNKEISLTGYYNNYRKIDLLNENSEEIYNKVGLYPYLEPFFYCFLNVLDRRIYIKKINYYRGFIKNSDTFPGKIFFKFGTILFFTKNGILSLHPFKDISFFDSIFLLFNIKTNKI